MRRDLAGDRDARERVRAGRAGGDAGLVGRRDRRVEPDASADAVVVEEGVDAVHPEPAEGVAHTGRAEASVADIELERWLVLELDEFARAGEREGAVELNDRGVAPVDRDGQRTPVKPTRVSSPVRASAKPSMRLIP